MRQRDVALAIARANPAGPDVSGYVSGAARSELLLAILASPSTASAERSSASPSTRARRRVALAGASLAALAAIVAGILVLSSGPTAPPAAAAVLRQTAAVASATPPELPGPGQFLYSKAKTLELEGWFPGCPCNRGGPINRPGAFNALVPTDRESWIAPDGAGRRRETLGSLQFLSSEEKSRWEGASEPLPGGFDPSYQEAHAGLYENIERSGGRVLELGRGVEDIENARMEGFKFPDSSKLPTDPEALRAALQDHRVSGPWKDYGDATLKPLGVEETIVGLWSLLGEATTGPMLRAAAFNALAELPGIELEGDATDLFGREGKAIAYTHGDSGVRSEYIFDPDTARVLGSRTVLVDPTKARGLDGIPAGTVIREAANLQSGVVDSTQETAAEGQGPAATSGPAYRR